MDLGTLQSKVSTYNEILSNTQSYRKDWGETIKPMVTKNLEMIIKETDLTASIDLRDDIENLEVIILSLGQEHSGISEKLQGSSIKRHMIKNNGALVYQQLFNGKIMIMIMYPFIEGYGEPKPPKTLEILRPEELKEPYIVRHVESLLSEVIQWEDYDDDVEGQIKSNPIGFNNMIETDLEMADITGK